MAVRGKFLDGLISRNLFGCELAKVSNFPDGFASKFSIRRSFSHVRNNWATYAYAAPDKGVAEQISILQSELCKALSLEPVETPHLRCEA